MGMMRSALLNGKPQSIVLRLLCLILQLLNPHSQLRMSQQAEKRLFSTTVTDNGGLQDTDTCIVNVIPLSASGTIYGIVTDQETGEPISGVIIVAMCKDVSKKKTSTNASGHYELTNLEDVVF